MFVTKNKYEMLLNDFIETDEKRCKVINKLQCELDRVELENFILNNNLKRCKDELEVFTPRTYFLWFLLSLDRDRFTTYYQTIYRPNEHSPVSFKYSYKSMGV